MFEDENSGYHTETSTTYNCYQSKGGRIYTNEVKASEYTNLFNKQKTHKIGKKSKKRRNSTTRDSLKIDSVFDYEEDSVKISPEKNYLEDSLITSKETKKHFSRTKSEKVRAGKLQQRSTVNMIKIIQSDICDIIYRLQERIERFGGYGCKYENGDLTCRSSESRSLKRYTSLEVYELNSLKLKAKALFFEGLNLIKTYYELNSQYSTSDRNSAFSHGLKNFLKKGVNFENEVDCLEAVIKIKRKLESVVKEYEEEWSEICSNMESSEIILAVDLSKNKKEFDCKMDFRKRKISRKSRSNSKSKGIITPRTLSKSSKKSEKKTNKKSGSKRNNCPEIEVKITRRSRKNSTTKTSRKHSISLEKSPRKVITHERFEKVEEQLKQIMLKLQNLDFSKQEEINKENNKIEHFSKRSFLDHTEETKLNIVPMNQFDKLKSQADDTEILISDRQYGINTPKPFRTTATRPKESPFKQEMNLVRPKIQSNTPNLIRKENKFTVDSSNNHLPAFRHKFDSVNEIDPINAFIGQKTEKSSKINQNLLKENMKNPVCYKKPVIQPEIFITPPSSIYTGELDINQIPASMNCSRVFYNSKFNSKNNSVKYHTNQSQDNSNSESIHVLHGTLDGNNFTLQGENDQMEEIEVEKISGNYGKFKEENLFKVGDLKKKNLVVEGKSQLKDISSYNNSVNASYTLSDVNSLEYEIFKVREERAEQLLKLEEIVRNSGKFLKRTITGTQAQEFVDQNIFQLKVAMLEFSKNYKFTSECDKQLEKNIGILEKKLNKAKSLLSQSCLFEGETKENFVYGIYGLVEKSIFCFEKFIEMAKEQYDDILPISDVTTPTKSTSNFGNRRTAKVRNSEYEEESHSFEEIKLIQSEEKKQPSLKKPENDIFNYNENGVELSGLRKSNSYKSQIDDEDESVYSGNGDQVNAKSTAANSIDRCTNGTYVSERDGNLEVILEKNEKHETSSNLEIIDCDSSNKRRMTPSSRKLKEVERTENGNSSVKIVTMKGGFIGNPSSSGYTTDNKSHFNLMSTNGVTYIKQKNAKETHEFKCRTSKTVEEKTTNSGLDCYRENLKMEKFEILEREWSDNFSPVDSNLGYNQREMEINVIKSKPFFASQKESKDTSVSDFDDENNDESVQRRLDVPPVGFELYDAETPKSDFEFETCSKKNDKCRKIVKLEINSGIGKINVIKLIPNSDKCAIGLSSGELIFYSISKKVTLLCKKKHNGGISSMEYLKTNQNYTTKNKEAFSYKEDSPKKEPEIKPENEYKEYLITGGDDQDRSIIVWDLKKMKALKRFSGHKKLITSIKNIGDNSTIASTSYDGKIALWDLSTKFNCVQLLENHKAPVSALHINSKENLMISGTLNGEIIIWKIYKKSGVYDAISLKSKLKIGGHIVKLSMSKINKKLLIVLESDANVRIYDTSTGEVKSVLKSEEPFTDFFMIERDNLPPILYCVKKGCDFEKFDSLKKEFKEEDEISLLGNEVNPSNIGFVMEMFGFSPKNQVMVKDGELFLVGFEKKKKRIVFRSVEYGN